MSSRSRQSRIGATPSHSRHSLAPTLARGTQDALPPYKKPSHPLDGEAQRALRELNGQTLSSIKKHNKDAIVQIRTSAEGINDMLSEHLRYFDARSKKWDAGKKLDEKDEEESIMADLQKKVDAATAKLEESMRAVIDSSVAAQRIEDTLEWLRQAAPRQLEEEYQSQRPTQRRQTQNDERSDAGSDFDLQMDEGPTPGPTPLDGSRVTFTGSVDMFNDRMAREADTYTSNSLTARYARHNDYRDFKRVIHDARYGDEGPVLGHEDTWFTEDGEPQLGVTQRRGGAYDDEDDLVMDKATISTKCPLTFQQLKEPYSSKKCPHTFEKTAILGMIRSSTARFGPGGRKSVECPIPGCDQQLSAEDLRVDPILVRKIRRVQAAELEASQMDSDDGEDEDEEMQI